MERPVTPLLGLYKKKMLCHTKGVTAEIPFNELDDFLRGKTWLRVTRKPGCYEVLYYAPPPTQTDFLAPPTSPIRDPELDSKPRFTWETDPIGCERRACAWGRKGPRK